MNRIISQPYLPVKNLRNVRALQGKLSLIEGTEYDIIQASMIDGELHTMNPDIGYYSLRRPEIARLIIGQPTRILEVGCARGLFKQNITWPCEYHGVELVKDVASQAEESGVITHIGTYEDVKKQLPDNYFDLIVCNDVIEHMTDPWAFLQDVKCKMSPQGQLIGSVPNVRYCLNLKNLLVNKDWKYESAGILDRTHYRFFTVKSLRQTLQSTGYQIDKLYPSGPDKYKLLKKIISPLAFILGCDTLYAQIAFSVHCELRPNS